MLRVYAGRHKIKLTADGFEDYEKVIDVKAGKISFVTTLMRKIAGRNCLEVIKGHNNFYENRVNIVFTGFGYNNPEELRKFVDDRLINENGDGTILNSGLFSDSIFKNYRNKFNILVINKTYTEGYESLESFDKIIFSECSIDGRNLQRIAVIKDNGWSSALIGGGLVFLFTKDMNPSFSGEILVHELGHSLGGLYDEYQYMPPTTFNDPYFYPDPIPNIIPNCEYADSNVACGKWCSGLPVPERELEALDCGSMPLDKCASPCGILNEDGSDKCVNIVKSCKPLGSNNCESVTDTSGRRLCVWGYNPDPYYESNCIPIIENNIGNQCIENTKCLQVCSESNFFRSSENSKMRSLGAPWQFINERHLKKVLEGGSTTPRNNIVTERFADNGKISGVSLDLDRISTEAQDKLIKKVKERTGKDVVLKKGKIDIRYLNIPALTSAVVS